jgi:FixJ family two-component response regulator
MINQGKTKLITIVDDDDSMRSVLQGLLKAAGLPAQAFASGEELLQSGQQHQTACLIADIRARDVRIGATSSPERRTLQDSAYNQMGSSADEG